MMSEQDARDPFLGLNEHIRGQARGEVPTYYTVGKILSTTPLTVRADGMDLDLEDLYVAEHLTAGWLETLTGLSWPLTAELPEKTFYGHHICAFTGNPVSNPVTRPAETVEGETTESAPVTHGALLKAGDQVLLLRSPDGQTYYLLERLVKTYYESVSAD